MKKNENATKSAAEIKEETKVENTAAEETTTPTQEETPVKEAEPAKEETPKKEKKKPFGVAKTAAKKAAKAVKEAPANTKASIDRKVKHHNHKKHGVNDATETGFIPGQLSKFTEQTLVDELSAETLKNYTEKFYLGKFKDNSYFVKKDGKIYELTKKFYEGEIGDPDFECNIMDITRFFNILRRQIINKPFNDEKSKAKLVQMSYASGKPIKTVTFYEDVLKEVAWCVCHAYCTGLFANTKGIFDLIPKNGEVTSIWNAYVQAQEDVPDFVKQKFIIKENGENEFINEHKDKFCSNSPSDDIAFSDEESNVRTITLIDEHIKKANAELDKAFHAAVEKDDKVMAAEPAPITSAVTPSKPDTKEEFTFGGLKAKEKFDNNTVNPAKIAAALQQKQEYQKVETPVTPNGEQIYQPTDEKVDMYQMNNDEWGKSVPRLNRFTDIVHQLNDKVLYNQDSKFLGLIRASIYDKKNNWIRDLVIDPCLMYGDSLRVVTQDDPDNDIRKELFIPISQQPSVVKAIKGQLSGADKRTIREKIPKVFYMGDNFEERFGKYHYLDRVDMRGLKHTDGRTGLNLEDWRKLVYSISNILKDEACPICRFRIEKYESPDRFILSCDQSALCAYPSEILYDPSNVECINRGIKVVYDEKANPDKPYTFLEKK